MYKTLKCIECRKNWVPHIAQIEIQMGGPNNSAVLQNRFPPKKLGPTSLTCKNILKLRKVLLNHVECIEI